MFNFHVLNEAVPCVMQRAVFFGSDRKPVILWSRAYDSRLTQKRTLTPDTPDT